MNFTDTAEKEQKNKRWIKVVLVALVFLLLIILVFVSLINSHRTSRDIARLATISSLRADLELYFLNNIKYPDVLDESCKTNGLSGCCLDDRGFSRKCSGRIYINNIAPDPSGGNQGFFYSPTENNGSYILTYSLEGNNGYLTPGFHKATPFSVGE